MKLIKLFPALLFFGLMFHIVRSQESTPVPVLNAADIDRFIQTIVPMSKEFDESDIETEGDVEDTDDMGMDYEEDDMDMDFDVWSTSAEAMAILSKYGWDAKDYGRKTAAIIWGYSYLVMLDKLAQISEDQKTATEEGIKTYTDLYKSLVHDDDVKLIKSKKKELDLMNWDDL